MVRESGIETGVRKTDGTTGRPWAEKKDNIGKMG
jgi:hypothetical protein